MAQSLWCFFSVLKESNSFALSLNLEPQMMHDEKTITQFWPTKKRHARQQTFLKKYNYIQIKKAKKLEKKNEKKRYVCRKKGYNS